jgi:quercetin dioxygenase-like cupin family protein
MPGEIENRSSVITEVAKWPVDGLEGREGRWLTIEYGPGVHTPAHTHPGWGWIWVLEGKVVSQMKGEPPQEYGPGDFWYEPRDHVHLDIGNDSSDQPAKVLVFYLTEPGQPILIPAQDE